jgi:glycosyltransferase involved in cell wall biosynthesis
MPQSNTPDINDQPNVVVVIPCYKVSLQIMEVINNIGEECNRIIVVDDACPEKSGALVERECIDERVTVIYNESNLGVGGAVLAGYRLALDFNADIVVKIDGDGQMEPSLIPKFIEPISQHQADYTKGNRFYHIPNLSEMPLIRLFGNAVLSFFTKLSSGYWNNFDPTNGYTAIQSSLIPLLPPEKVSNDYFFESDMLFRLNLLQAKVVDVPMSAKYSSESSNLMVRKIIPIFLYKNIQNLIKRLFYNYFLRDFSAASIELISGFALATFGFLFGAWEWYAHVQAGEIASTGTVMVSVLPLVIGFQFLIAFLNFDLTNTPSLPICPKIKK